MVDGNGASMTAEELRERARAMRTRVDRDEERARGPSLMDMLGGDDPDIPDLNFRGYTLMEKGERIEADLTPAEQVAYLLWILDSQRTQSGFDRARRVLRQGAEALEDAIAPVIGSVSLEDLPRIRKAIQVKFGTAEDGGPEGNAEAPEETSETSGDSSPSPATSSAGSPRSAPDSPSSE